MQPHRYQPIEAAALKRSAFQNVDAKAAVIEVIYFVTNDMI